jgi:hypothetical protein
MSYSIYLRDGSHFVITAKNLEKLKAVVQSKGFKTVEDYFRDNLFRLEIMDGGGDGLWFDGDRMCDEIEVFLKVVAPFVKKGSFIEMEGEDGGIWRWVFNGKTFKEQEGKVSFE